MDAWWIAIILQIVTLIIWWLVYFFWVKQSISLLQKDIDLIKKDVGKIEWIEEYIKNLSCYFDDNNIGVPTRLKEYESKISVYYQANSPVKLTQKGENLVKNSWFEKIFLEKKDFIIQIIKQKLINYANADDDLFFYFAEKKSVDSLKEMYEEWDALLNPIRSFIFSHWLRDEEKEIITALGIYVRDEVIKNYNRWEVFEKLQQNTKKEK